MARLTLQLHPVDVLMFRETRWFGTGAGASESLFPLPRTIAGAIRTYLLEACLPDYTQLRAAMKQARKEKGTGKDYLAALRDKLSTLAGSSWPLDAQIVGPFLGCHRGRYLPLPKCIVAQEADRTAKSPKAPCSVLLKPIAIGAGASARHVLATGDDKPWKAWSEGFVCEESLTSFLSQGSLPCAAEQEVMARAKMILDESRVGVGIDGDSGTAREGLLYTSTFSRLQQGWHLEADVELDETGAQALRELQSRHPWLRLGGDGKVARVELAERAWQPPAAPTNGTAPLLYLATPGLFAGGAPVPASLDGHVVAMASGKPVAFSGWDLAANLPMPSRYAVPAGTVYFLNDLPDPDPHNTCISDDPDDRKAGWGYCLRGVWSA